MLTQARLHDVERTRGRPQSSRIHIVAYATPESGALLQCFLCFLGQMLQSDSTTEYTVEIHRSAWRRVRRNLLSRATYRKWMRTTNGSTPPPLANGEYGDYVWRDATRQNRNLKGSEVTAKPEH